MDNGITFEKVSHIYQPNSPFSHLALNNASFKIEPGDFVAIIGHTGSGKSTLVQHINALLKPTTGQILIYNTKIQPETSNKNLKQLRHHVGMVFQFPENQLFEETVIKDIMFGPKNYGASDDEARTAAKEAMQMIGLESSLADKSPFDLSGGQRRRVAIAGVLAMKPEILVLDEPTAGLDPRGRTRLLDLITNLNQTQKVTIVLVTHQMEDVVDYAKKIIVMDNGRVIRFGNSQEIFGDPSWVKAHHLNLPRSAQFSLALKKNGVKFDRLALTIDQLADKVSNLVKH